MQSLYEGVRPRPLTFVRRQAPPVFEQQDAITLQAMCPKQRVIGELFARMGPFDTPKIHGFRVSSATRTLSG